VPWRMRAFQIGFGAFLAFLCAVFLLKAPFNHIYRLRRSEALLLEKSRDMEALNARFELLLSNIPQGVAWFGRDQRLLIANSRYGEIYDLSPGDVKPGVPLEEILAKRVAKGMFVESPRSLHHSPIVDDPGLQSRVYTGSAGERPDHFHLFQADERRRLADRA
jgi:PAS domain-containing protein